MPASRSSLTSNDYNQWQVPETPVPLLLHSNDPPTEQQVYRIKQAIAGAETILSSLEYRKQLCGRGDVCYTSDQVDEQREKFTEFIRVHTSVLSPYRRLPPELLREIFMWLVPLDSPHTVLSPLRNWVVPATRTCKTWRVAAHTYVPELWSFVPMVRLNKKTAEDAKYVQGLERFLNLSVAKEKVVSLRIQVYAPFREYDSLERRHPALEVLMKHAERWEYLKMDSAYRTFRCLESVRDKLSVSLKYLHVEIWRYPPGEPLDVFGSAVRLEDVTVRGLMPQDMALPWGNLRVYTEKVMGRGGLANILDQAKRLKRLEVTRSTDLTIASPMELPNLETLYLRYDDVIPPDNIIDKFIVPVLKDMQIIGSPGELIPHLIDLIHRSRGCKSLKRLAFRTQAMSPGDLTVLLRGTPQLEELDINHPPNRDAEMLIFNPFNDNPLVPYLRRLYIHSQGDWGDEATYKRIARTRCEASFLKLTSPSQRLSGALIKPLESLRFAYEHPALCATQQAIMGGWFDPSVGHGGGGGGGGDPTLQALLTLRNNLIVHLPEVDLGGSSGAWDLSVPKKRVFDVTFSRRLNGIFGDLEGVEVGDVKHIYRSDIHMTLRKVANIRENHIPGDEKYRFRERASEILKSWKPLFAEDLANGVRWYGLSKELIVMEFPIELVEVILDNVEERRDLEACAAVCRDWSALGQTRLFKSITLRKTRNFQQLLGIVQGSPHIASAIKRVKLDVMDAAKWCDDDATTCPVTNCNLNATGVNTVSGIVADILRALPNIRSLSLKGLYYEDRLHWESLPYVLQEAIILLVQDGELEELDIDGWVFDFPIHTYFRTFLSAPSLRRVRLKRAFSGLHSTPDYSSATTEEGEWEPVKLNLHELEIHVDDHLDANPQVKEDWSRLLELNDASTKLTLRVWLNTAFWSFGKTMDFFSGPAANVVDTLELTIG
ncbi:hypothetical protein H1R20_g15426, partial [Candolleomyces eurysporus]